MAEGHRRAQALALARATAQARHLGVDEGLVEKDQPVRLLAHAGLTLARPDTTLVTNVGACALRGHLGFFIGEAATAQQARESGRGRAYAMLVQQSRRQFGHGDVRPSLHRADQKRFVTGQLARATRPALASRAGDPHCLWRCISLRAKLSLTLKWRAAARREWPASTKAATRTRKSRE